MWASIREGRGRQKARAQFDTLVELVLYLLYFVLVILVHRIQELIYVAENSEINAIIAILIKRSYRESALRSVRYSCCRSTANSCISLVLT